MTNEIYVLLWSHSQKAFHVETLADTLAINQRAYAAKRPMDYVLIYAHEERARVSAFRETLIAKHGRPE